MCAGAGAAPSCGLRYKRAPPMASASSFRPRDAAVLLLLALIWGNSFLFIKTAVAVVPPAWVVVVRMLLGASLLMLMARLSGKPGPKSFASTFKFGLIGLCGSGLPWLGQAWAQQFLDSGLVSVLNATTPVATLLVAVTLKQERLYLNRVLGLSLAVLGTLLVVGGEVRAGRSTAALAVAVLVTFGYAIAAVLTRARLADGVKGVWAPATQLTWGVLLLGPVAFALDGPPTLVADPWVVGSLLALGLLGTGVAFLLYFMLLENVGATNTSMVTYLAPIFGLSAGALFRGERFGANVLAGAALMLVGVWLAQRAPRVVMAD